ncbi:MAG: translocation/assembly module TamB domain-containing protein [Muribaculaceae bacterium]|nr:translocation/assembly module TamB domain-containing protein [Muribaculaceae bacterium]
MVGIYGLLYILISIPAFQNHIKKIVVKELSEIIGSNVEIDQLRIYPFSEVEVSGLVVYDLTGEKCLEVETVGAGIRLWKLLTEKRFEITFGEIIGLNANIVQKEEGGELNIKFIIDAFSNKEKKKERKAFDLALRNVVLRKSGLSFKREWMDSAKMIGKFNPADINISDLNADLSFPRITEKEMHVDLRRLSLSLPEFTQIEKMGLKGYVTPDSLGFSDLVIELPATRLHIPEFSLPVKEGENIVDIINKGTHRIDITESYITPSDFSFLLPLLSFLDKPIPLEVSINGNLDFINIEKFFFGDISTGKISFKGELLNLLTREELSGHIDELEISLLSSTMNSILPGLDFLAENIKYAISHIGDVQVKGDFAGSRLLGDINGNIDIISQAVEVKAEGNIRKKGETETEFDADVIIDHLLLSELFPSIPVNDVKGNIAASGAMADIYPDGKLAVVIDEFILKGKEYEGFFVNLEKEGKAITGDLLIDNEIGFLETALTLEIGNDNKNGEINMSAKSLDLSEVIDMKAYNGYLINGDISITASGNDMNDVTGDLLMSDFKFESPDKSRNLELERLELNAKSNDGFRNLQLSSDWLEGSVEGDFKVKDVVNEFQWMLHRVMPDFWTYSSPPESNPCDIDFEFSIPVNNELTEFFKLPVRLLVPVNIKGNMSSLDNKASFVLDVPFLQQGRDKLIEGTKILADLDGQTGELNAIVKTIVPVKKGELDLTIDIYANDNKVSTDVKWINTINSNFKGILSIESLLTRNMLSNKPEFKLDINPSVLSMGTADWRLEPCEIKYSGDEISIGHLKIWHGNQFVEINGVASSLYSDVVTITLADIDVDYIFDMLSINYVTFGGTATGEIAGHALLSGDPVAETETLQIVDFSYNGAVIGTCDVTSRWNNESKEVEINADISHDGVLRVLGKGGIWLTKDSLAFDIMANKVPVEFVQPFMSAFSSHVGGFATGDVCLYGTFKDIDMIGQIFADSVAVRLDYTNTVYHGSDSVLLYPGRIEIPSFTLYDKNGNSALLTGELTHRYFHEPSFNFRLSDARNFLCYDTSSEINPDWYGMLYGTGSALVRGVPGLVDISADMTISDNSRFTFVLNDRQYARDYQFLTFSDRRKEALLAKENNAEDFKAKFKKQVAQQNNSPSKFGIDIRATVTPQVMFTLVMDPAAGDKITARGRGAMQVKYNSDDDEMQMYGKYEIEEGNYNFSLQDIILRDFKIKEGSFISFNGNPLAADLDISATYRVNTNLSDLDKSFSTDRDLNRTNVPVDAVLSVSGNMQQPDITFDIELPTLTQDVERKVKSIISTDDMMNRQIIYLLALNRFYTPEYMGASGNGGELAAVASSTISSQLSNILGQLTDKVTVAPSFRSDKGDFSDIEVDVALSSRLLNNRLLINGNFGYRDKSNSSTTFVGDFDVEYLLSRNGNFRLKAYNHFNDQNYYLREALTTQGLGVVFRKDFDTLFPILRKKEKKDKESEVTDSLNVTQPALDN